MTTSQRSDVLSALLLLVMCAVAVLIVWHEYSAPSRATIDTELESGKHLTFVMIAPTSGGTSELNNDVRRARSAMRQIASDRQFHYSTVGVSDHWSVEAGLSILDGFGPFDEVVVGRNWFNLGITEFVSRMGGKPAVPQLLVTLQDIRIDTLPFAYGPRSEVIRLVGTGAIREWARRGFPIEERFVENWKQ